MFSPHIHFDDHTAEEQRTNTYLVVTVESIVKTLEKADSGIKVNRLRLDSMQP